jgi:hypothetical protein
MKKIPAFLRVIGMTNHKKHEADLYEAAYESRQGDT